ncbi:hypothetical protein WJX74_002625 [Apatococcus lobatus]|uniref:Derlin n=1 Tax=Apatococcus lobatus TaxID=904363 RepID=A0AAW1QUG9_9CHLO
MSNVRQGPSNGPADFFNSIPPITRAWMAGCVLAVAAPELGILNLRTFILSWGAVFSHFQIWRLVTNFFVLHGRQWNTLFKLLWMFQYGKALEGATFQHDPAQYAFMLLFGACTTLAMALAVPVCNSMPVHGPDLVFFLMYVWSREYPTQTVNIMGVVSLEAFYLPFAFATIDLVAGGNWISSLMGILAGHLWFYLTKVHPTAGRYLQAPNWLRRGLDSLGLSRFSGNTGPAAPPTNSAFRGQGRRLG